MYEFIPQPAATTRTCTQAIAAVARRHRLLMDECIPRLAAAIRKEQARLAAADTA